MRFKQYITEQMVSLFNVKVAGDIKKDLLKNIKAPFVNVKISTLGGDDRTSIILNLSLDDKKDWPNGILQNSRYAMFHINADGVIEQFTKSFSIKKKFRKSKFKNISNITKKINKYLQTIKG